MNKDPSALRATRTVKGSSNEHKRRAQDKRSSSARQIPALHSSLFVEKLVAKRKHQQNRARLLEGEDFADEDVESVAMTPYRHRDGAHSRLSSVTGGMPIEVHSRGMSASGALGDFGVLGGRDSPASTLSAPGTSSPEPRGLYLMMLTHRRHLSLTRALAV